MKRKRKEQFMTKLKSKTIPKRYLFFDMETTNPDSVVWDGHFRPLLGMGVYLELDKELNVKRRQIYEIDNQETFIALLDNLTPIKKKLHVFAHNIGFDIRVLELPELFNKIKWENEPPIINQLMFLWRVKTGKGTIQFIDTANLGVRSVEQIGKDLGFPKIEIDFNSISLSKLRQYCLRDVEILEKFVMEYIGFIDKNNLGSFKVTIASQALTTYRTKFMINAPYIHNYYKAIELERQGYFGGRTECFFIGNAGKSDWFYLDINSMYPSAMLEENIPRTIINLSYDIPLGIFKERLKRYYNIAQVTLNTEINMYPLRYGKKLIFPIGEFKTTLHQSELEIAYKNNDIIKVHKCSSYYKGNLFSDYIKFFSDVKVKASIEGKKGWRTIAKLYLNSLYGKFGQLQPERTELGVTDDKEIVWRMPVFDDKGNTYQEICWYGRIFRERKVGETTLSIPAIAGAITANARLMLYNFMLTCGLENVYYCDTDSIITNKKGYENLKPFIHQTKLGMLALEKTSNTLIIHNPKDYQFGNDIIIKGIPKNAELIEEGKWSYLQFQGFITWMNKGAINPPTGYYTEKIRKSNYSKGVVLKSGKVKPFKFVDGEPR